MTAFRAPLLDLSQPLTPRLLIAAYTSYATTTRPRRAPRRGEMPHISEASESATLSCVRRAFQYLVADTNAGERYLDTPVDAVMLFSLPEAARAAHARSAADAAGRVGRFVHLITGQQGGRSGRMAHPGHFVPPAYRPLIPYLRRNLRSQESALARFAQVAAAAGVTPQTMCDSKRLQSALAKADVSQSTFQFALAAYRSARAAFIAAHPDRAADFRPCPKRVTSRAYGLSAHPERVAVLICAARPDISEPLDLTADQQFAILMPKLHRQIESYCAHEGRHLSRAWRQQLRELGRRLCGLMILHGEEAGLPDATMLSFFEELRPEVFASTAAGAGDDDPDLAKDRAPHATARQITLLQRLYDLQAAEIAAQSPMQQDIAAQGKRYAMAVGHALEKLWWVVVGRFAEPLKNTTRWAVVADRYHTLDRHVRANSVSTKQAKSRKDKQRIIEMVTLPMVQCLILPAWARDAHAAWREHAEAAAVARAAGHDPRAHGLVTRLRQRAEALDLGYLVLALPCDDGKRLANYANGTLGYTANFRPSFAGATLKEMVSEWGRDVEDAASLKDHAGDGKDSRPRRFLRPGCVDHAILGRYVLGQRIDALVARGAVPSVAEYDLETDMRAGRWALLVSPKKSADPRGAYSEGVVSDRFGQALHRGAVDYLGRDLPRWEVISTDPAWRGLWAIHVSRLLVGSFWGGVRDLYEEIACPLTDDLRATLEGEYKKANHWLKEQLRGAVTWQHPAAFNSMMDRLYGHGRRWEAFDPLNELLALPKPERELMLPPLLLEKLEAARVASLPVATRRRRVQHRIRKARPGQQVAGVT